MLPHIHGTGYGKLADVSASLRLAAENREGDWQISVPERLGFFRDPLGVFGPKYTRVRFTEKEFARFEHLIMQPMRNGTKYTTMYANLEQAAATCYPSGSVEHVAMRHLGPVALVRYFTQAGTTDYNWYLLMKIMGATSGVILGFDRSFRGWPYGITLNRWVMGGLLATSAALSINVLRHRLFQQVDAPYLTRMDEASEPVLEEDVVDDPESEVGSDSERGDDDDDEQADPDVHIQVDYWLRRHRAIVSTQWASYAEATVQTPLPEPSLPVPSTAPTSYGPSSASTQSAAKAAPAVQGRANSMPKGICRPDYTPEVKRATALDPRLQNYPKNKRVIGGPVGLGSPPGLSVLGHPAPLGHHTIVRSPLGVHGGLTPEDATVMASMDEDGRTYTTDQGIVAVVGQEFDKTIPHDQLPIVGALLGPCSKPPNVYTKNLRNLRACIEERITNKQKGCILDKRAIKKIGWVISMAMSSDYKRGVFSEARIRAWCEEHFDAIESMKSGKWSLDRMRQAVMNLYAKTFLPSDEPAPVIDERGREYPGVDEETRFQFEAKLKPEDMAEGKSPRMLIAEGDAGQLMALVVIKCFEDLLFEWFEDKSIKHKSKKDAVKNIIKQLNKSGGCAIEGDGSAWDTTCGYTIRNSVENPILKHIMMIVIGYGVVPEEWHREHTKSCENKRLDMFYKDKFDKVRIVIDAIRRSGHRGTSVLNWWINFIMWITSIFKNPEAFLDPMKRCGEDVTGVSRWWNGVFEGDDSLCVLSPPMREGDSLSVKFLDYWSTAGFNMKIVFCRTRATVVGWHIACTNGRLSHCACPELPRALSNSGVGVSTSTVQAARTGNVSMIRATAAAAAMARAGEFAGILPTVSEKYLRYSLSLTNRVFWDREMSIRVFGSDGHDSREVVTLIHSANLAVTPKGELSTMRELGYGTTASEMDLFKTYDWSLEPAVLLDYQGFNDSLPLTWRS